MMTGPSSRVTLVWMLVGGVGCSEGCRTFENWYWNRELEPYVAVELELSRYLCHSNMSFNTRLYNMRS